MDEFTFHSEELGWIETNIKPLVTLIIDRKIANSLASGHSLRMATWLYDRISPPTFPYTRATSVFSAAVQLYSRSGQLPTADNLIRKHMSLSNICRFGCNAIEDTHHVFTACPTFTKFRDKAQRDVMTMTEKKLDQKVENEIERRAEFLFSDCTHGRQWTLSINCPTIAS